MHVDRLWRNARIATLDARRSGVGLIERGAVAVSDGRLVYVGKEADLPAGINGAIETDLEGRLITPGLIDCHTHLVFAGDRSDEFVLRLAGADYQTIAQNGGGIQSTVRATRAASEAQLIDSAEERLLHFLAEGITTIEIKSGYGLDLATELKMLRAARSLGRRHRVHICTTLLAAHAMPSDQDRQVYLDLITREIIPQAAAAGLADAVDGYCERIGFTAAELRQVFASARAHGLPVKVHADQLSDAGGAALAAECSALSADHLEWSNPAGIAALARAGTVAVLLPGAFFALRETQLPRVAELRRAGVRIALATDCNPGTSPLLSLLTAMSMAAVQFGLTVEETLAAVTREAAHALGLQQEVGTLEIGKRADMAIWNLERPAELIYWMGRNRLHARVWRGQ
ncbi:MAG TPA: imidazolonepropionase [Steroidobacteraceae bacterium]|nr:imidazolonepropionase [Steroidobacteraceae bacterium]